MASRWIRARDQQWKSSTWWEIVRKSSLFKRRERREWRERKTIEQDAEKANQTFKISCSAKFDLTHIKRTVFPKTATHQHRRSGKLVSKLRVQTFFYLERLSRLSDISRLKIVWEQEDPVWFRALEQKDSKWILILRIFNGCFASVCRLVRRCFLVTHQWWVSICKKSLRKTWKLTQRKNSIKLSFRIPLSNNLASDDIRRHLKLLTLDRERSWAIQAKSAECKICTANHRAF